MSLYTCEFEKWYFMSYYEGLPQLILEARRDDKYISKLEPALNDFCEELSVMVKKLQNIAA